jgi:hypothetical protein
MKNNEIKNQMTENGNQNGKATPQPMPSPQQNVSPHNPHPVSGDPHPSLRATLSHPMGEGNLPLPRAKDMVRDGEGVEIKRMLEVIFREIGEVRRGFGALHRSPICEPLRPPVPQIAPASDNEAARVFALLDALESETNYRKAPVTRVFQLYCLKAMTRNQVARACRCAPSLVTLRLQCIEVRLGRKPAELRVLSSHIEQIADSLRDDRARRIRCEDVLDDAGSDN